MKKTVAALSLLWLTVSASAQNSITLEDLWQKGTYRSQGLYGLVSMKDGMHYTVQKENAVEKYDYATGTLQQTYTFNYKGAPIEFDGYSFSDDESKLLLATDQESIYRYSTRENNLVYDLKNKTATPLSSKGKQMYATFSPVGNRVAYVISNNLYYKDLESGTEVQITRDGEVNKIINGGSDWVYEEEFTLVRAFEWSPDGKRIAFLRFDESQVPEFEMPMYNGEVYPDMYRFKYPKVGEKNSAVTLFIYDLGSSKTIPVKLDIAYEYIPRIKWNPNTGELICYTMNRLQNDLRLYRINPSDGSSSVLFHEQAPAYLEINDYLTFLKDGSFLWASEQDGYNHIYRYDATGKPVKKITSGNWDVTGFLGVDEAKKILYYESAEVSPMERHIYSISLDGKNKKDLTPQAGTNTVEFTEGYKYYICTHSAAGVPPTVSLYSGDGKLVRVLADNAGLNKVLGKLDISLPEFFTFKNSGGTDLNGYMIKPKNFDPLKKYPVFMFVYGGPGSQQVLKQWGGSNYIWFQMLAQKGYIIACVDNRGTGARGRDFRTCTYKQLGKLEVDDQIDAARYLGSLAYVDKTRIGIFGWSYGGYMSSLCITRGAEVFKAAIAVAPVSNWKFYDSIYTERYMGTKESNPNGYDDNAPTAFTVKLKGNYMLIHGTGDDNVHWQNTAELINALVKSNKQFDLFLYPNRNHGIYGGNTRYHLYTQMTNFLMEKL